MTNNDPGKFFLGKLYDENGNLTDENLIYDAGDLNTHCVITGMTGSGKTGLGIVLLEEIARSNIPAIVIDPKGDLTNLLLHFPELEGADFAPWIDPEAPIREGKPLAQLAEETAEKWKNGLAQWGLGAEDIRQLQQVSYKVFTPGSTIGNPINIMSSFEKPENAALLGDEAIREEISTSVTALLDLIGINNIDPIQSREHILLSNIIEQYWNLGRSIDIEEMINAVNNPPFEKLGALPIDKVYPPKDRFQLSLLLNNFLASPSFETWYKGPNLDIGKMLYTPEGKARFNVFYIQHLSDHERMFFVTMLYSQIEMWMRQQSGTGKLRLAVYFDEIAGYLPPKDNVPSKEVILRMLKQARAFGVSMILSSQNPIDFNYKALSNAGTWFVGHLQTEFDKNRLLDGLSTTAGAIDRTQANHLISALKNRQFLYMNVHKPGLKVFTTRWALNYLAGPLTRNLIPELVQSGLSESNDRLIQNTEALTVEETIIIEGEEKMEGSEKNQEIPEGTKPEIASTINEYYRKISKSGAEVDAADDQITYIPSWIAQAEARIIQSRYNLDFINRKATLIMDPDIRGTSINWREYEVDPFIDDSIQKRPEKNDAKYEMPSAWMLEGGAVRSRESDFVDFVYRDGDIKILGNSDLKVYASPEVSRESFIEMCKDKVADASEKEREKLTDAYQKVVDRLETRIRKAEADVTDKLSKVSSKNLEKYGAFGEFVIGLFTGRRRSVSTSINKYGQSTNASNALDKAQLALDELKSELERETDNFKDQIEAVTDKWTVIAEKEPEEIPVLPMKKDIFTDYFGILWEPYYTDSAGKLVKAF